MRIIVTGGTFDNHYDAIRDELTFKDSHLPAILEQARVTAPVVLDINQLIDSLHMTDADRQSVLTACRSAAERTIIVVHGADTITEATAVIGAAGRGHFGLCETGHTAC